MVLIKPGQWTSGLCDCGGDCCNCIVTCCCPCITFGRNSAIIHQGEKTCCCAAITLLLLSCVGCSCLYSCGHRTKLRKQFLLPKDPCGDCLVHCFCQPCALCQEYRELKNRGYDPSTGWAGSAAKMQAPVVVPGMYRY